MRRKLAIFVVAVIFSFSVLPILHAESSDAVDLVAETIEYDSTQGLITAQGSVKLTRDGAIVTGETATYNTKSKEAYITGNVKMVRQDTTLHAAEVRSYDNNYMVATGEARLVKGDNTAEGEKIEYWTDKAYSLITGQPKLTMPDGVMTAEKIEAYHNEDKAIGSGQVHIVSDTRKLDATADQAVYYGDKQGQGKVVLTGDARAVQEGNTLTGNTLTLQFDNKTIGAEGRSKLVVTPQ
ncbi:MAG: OstA family protein [Firmicutes bacterium]|nr:OstA family protein [Bacillota bacterium]